MPNTMLVFLLVHTAVVHTAPACWQYVQYPAPGTAVYCAWYTVKISLVYTAVYGRHGHERTNKPDQTEILLSGF